MDTQSYINVAHSEQGVTTIEFFTPKANSMSSSMLADLANHITELSVRQETRVIVLRSKGKVFCSGASFDELKTIKTNEESKTFFSGFAKVILAMKHSPKFIIAQVQGKAVGGGVGILSTADYVIATEGVQVRLSEISIGIGPFVIEPAVSRRIGLIATQHLTYNPLVWFDSQWALSKGMLDEVVAAEDLTERVSEKAKEIAGYSPQSIAENKAMFFANTHHWEGVFEVRASKSGNLLNEPFCQQFLAKH